MKCETYGCLGEAVTIMKFESAAGSKLERLACVECRLRDIYVSPYGLVYELKGRVECNTVSGKLTPTKEQKLGEEEDVLGDLVKDARRVFRDIGEVMRGYFTPNTSSPIGPEFATDDEPTGGTSIQEQYTEALYNRQPHYDGGIDPITFGKDNLDPKEMNGFYKMNVIKYVVRCDRKNGLEDLQKARDYLNLLIASYEEDSE